MTLQPAHLLMAVGRRSKPRARSLSAALVAEFAAPAGCGAAVAADGLNAATEEPATALEQTAEQAADTTQRAGAQATSTQTGATNVAAPTVIANPATTTTVVQENSAGADSSSANTSETTQAAGQAQMGASGRRPDGRANAPSGNSAQPSGSSGQQAPAPKASTSGGSKSGGQPASAGGQSASQTGTTTQGAGAQARVVQTQPVNAAIPIVIGSPGAKTIIKQSNNAIAKANATNSSWITQVIEQMQKRPPAGGSSLGGDAGQGGSGTPVGGGVNQVIDTLVEGSSPTLIWIWNWEWNWGDWNWNSDWDTNVRFPPIPSPSKFPDVTPPGSWFPSDGSPLTPASTRDAGSTNASEPGHGLDEGTGGGSQTGSPAVPMVGDGASRRAPAQSASHRLHFLHER